MKQTMSVLDPETASLTDIQGAYLVGRRRGTNLGGVRAVFGVEIEVDPRRFPVSNHSVDSIVRALAEVVDVSAALSAQVGDDGELVYGAAHCTTPETIDLREVDAEERRSALEDARDSLDRAPLGVMSREVGQPGDWRIASEGGVGPVVIVEVEPGR